MHKEDQLARLIHCTTHNYSPTTWRAQCSMQDAQEKTTINVPGSFPVANIARKSWR